MQAASNPESPPLPFANCYWVLPGRLLAGEYPAGLTPEATRERLQHLAAAGIDCCVDLTVPGELPLYEEWLPAGCEHRRFPIADHGVPAERAQMAQAVEFLHQALRARRAVYLHCRAGIGRTGMVAGCLLAERGFSGDAALVELNRLWQQSGRAAHWPSVPETAAQATYVREWLPVRSGSADPYLDPQALTVARGLRERFLGALLGLAVGDAVAAATQYRRPGRFAPVGDLLGGGPFDLPRGGWSDDTAMALCLAESLIECDAFDAHDQVARYLRWQQQGHLSATGECLGITAGTSRALARSQWRRQAFSGSHDPEILDPEALSRVAPVAMYFFAAPQLAEAQAAEAARTTSQAPAVLAACRRLARALHAALAGQPRAAILAQIPAPARSGTPPAVAGVSAPEALAAAVDAFARSDNFRDAVLGAANLGGNSDVIAAVCGALAGAHYTAGSIPALWRNSLMKRELIEAYADGLLAHALVELGG